MSSLSSCQLPITKRWQATAQQVFNRNLCKSLGPAATDRWGECKDGLKTAVLLSQSTCWRISQALIVQHAFLPLSSVGG